MRILDKYSTETLNNILTRFQEYHETLRLDKKKTPIGVKMDLKEEKHIFRDFSLVTEFWEQEILNSPLALFDEVETVIDAVRLELHNRRQQH